MTSGFKSLRGAGVALMAAAMLGLSPTGSAWAEAPAFAACQQQAVDGVWTGQIEWFGHGAFSAEWQFHADGSATSPGTTNGVWQWDGPWLQINAVDSNGNHIDYRGRMQGDRLEGRALARAKLQSFEGTFVFTRR